MTLAVPPIIVSSALVSGANERFRERLSATPRYWIALGFFVLILVILLIWGIAGGGYPWWVAPIAFVITLLVFGIRPLRVVLSAPVVTDGETRPRNLPLPVRLTTVFLGLFFGLACAVVLVPALAWFVMMLCLGAAIVGLSARTAAWGLLRTGYEWHRGQWDLIEADDSAVSKGISHLERLGYVKVTKGYVGARPRTWVRSTAKGRRAFDRHVRALRAITGPQDP